MSVDLASQPDLTCFALVATRTFGLVTFAPPFASPVLSWRQRAGLSLVLGIAVAASAGRAAAGPPEIAGGLGVRLLSEFFFGAVVGFAARCALEVLRGAGGFVGLQAGLRGTGTPDLLGGVSRGPAAQLALCSALLVFLVCDGHHLLLLALLTSLRWVPAGMLFHLPAAAESTVIDLAGQVLLLGAWLALPAVLVLLLAEVLLALVQRSSPGLLLGSSTGPLKAVVFHLLLVAICGFLLPWEAAWIGDGLGRALDRVVGVMGAAG